MTGDGPLGYYLGNVYKSKWFSFDVEMESGCGIAPIEYRNKSLVHAWQWAIGLEWYLLVQDPWRVAMSTDHPNGGSFLAYPQIIRLLMDRHYRQEILKECHPVVREHSLLRDLTREYSLSEIAIITRAGPAQMLGLKHKGHLGPGADADITIYTPHENKQTMFELPRFVIKSGRILVEQGDIRQVLGGKTMHVAPAYDVSCEDEIREWFEQVYCVQFRNYPVGTEYLKEQEVVACEV
jgi:formylmethanofuran dehydrogenase subunit A